MRKLLILILFLFAANAISADVEDVIKDVEKKYKKIDLVKIDFKQVNRFKLTGIENELYGTLWLSQDNKFRLETEDQTLVSNGETFWRYNKLENQVLLDYAKKSQQDVFMNNFLFKISDHYYSQIVKEAKVDGKKVYEIKLTPKNPDDSFFQYLKVWITDGNWNIRRVLYVDYNDNESEYLVEDMKIDPEAHPELFQFKVPEGVEVVDLRF